MENTMSCSETTMFNDEIMMFRVETKMFRFQTLIIQTYRDDLFHSPALPIHRPVPPFQPPYSNSA
ncbi:MAG: hypothetical protein GY757_31425 [bacterium]|nr:hypothetical protein [bacterium]